MRAAVQPDTNLKLQKPVKVGISVTNPITIWTELLKLDQSKKMSHNFVHYFIKKCWQKYTKPKNINPFPLDVQPYDGK